MSQVRVRRVEQVLALAPDAGTWLAPSEQQRVARLRVAERRNQYLAGHWMLRCLLAEQLDSEPCALTLIERENLPPALAGSSLQLSLTHGGDWIAAAWSAAPIGIDLEPRQPRPALDRLQHLLLNDEEAPGSLDNDALLQRWVLKEALIKRDHGSALPQQLAELQLRPAVTQAIVEIVSTDAWHLAIAPAGAFIDHEHRMRRQSGWALCRP